MKGGIFMAINGLGSYYANSYYSTLFSGMNSSKKSSSYGTTSTDLMSLMKMADKVRSASFRKDMKEMFSTSSSDSASSSSVGSVESENNLSTTAKKLQETANAMSSLSADDFKDPEKLQKAVEGFAEKYNSTIDALKKSDSVDALRAGVSMTNTVKTYSGALRRIGIDIGSDNKLTVNAEKLKAADPNSVKSMFTTNYSMTTRIANKASDISKAAANKAQTTAFKSYTSQGTAKNYFSNYSIGSLLDMYM